jgi:hypothetical protein
MHDESPPRIDEEHASPIAIADERRSCPAEERRSSTADKSRSPIAGETRPLAALSDDDLLLRLKEVLRQSRRVEKDLVAHIAEVDERRLYAREASPSMFAYATEALRLSESEAYRRIAVARASREHPVILEMLGDGRLHLSGAALLAPHLTRESREVLLLRAMHRSKRQIEELIAELAPREDVPALLRRLPERQIRRRGATTVAPGTASATRSATTSATAPGMGRAVTTGPAWVGGVPSLPDGPLGMGGAPGPAPAVPSSHPLASPPPAPPPVVQPLAPGRYRVQFTASAALREKLERLRALMRSQVPDGDLGAIIEAAVTEKLERLEARRFATTSCPRKSLSQADTSPASRHIPAPVRRAVRERDGGRCRYVDASGRRCEERSRLEFHHLHPFGLGGDHRLENIRLMCVQHNLYLAEHDYGRETMDRFRRSGERMGGVLAVVSAGRGATDPRSRGDPQGRAVPRNRASLRAEGS